MGGVQRIHAGIAGIRDTLNAADRRFGDGDTGMTIEQIVIAWQAIQPADVPNIGAALTALGREASRASGSSLGSVLAMGFRAAGRAASAPAAADARVASASPDGSAARDSLDRLGLVAALSAARDAIVSRSGAAIGDKTILDSIAAMEQALVSAAADADLHAVALAAAERALTEFRERESRIGRARMYGAKSAGSDDPGMLAAVLLLRAAR